MGFFKEFKDDFSQAVNELMPGEDELTEKEDTLENDDMVVNTLDAEVDTESELSKLNGLLEQVTEQPAPQAVVKPQQVAELEKEFTRELEIKGVGYRAQNKGNGLLMNLGYSHPVEVEAPEGITFDVPDANHIVVRGINKELVGQTAANIRTKRPPEVYRGKGIKYAEEHIRRKEGKAGKK